MGRLRYTITPNAVKAMSLSGVWSVDDLTKNGQCFYQYYDKRGRVIIKHSPDGGELHFVYDNRDRLVLTQDANQRNRTANGKPNQWSYSLYDEYDRNVVTGLIDDTRDRATMQIMVDNLSLTPPNKQVEIFTGSWETITAYNPVAGQITGGGYYCQSCTSSLVNSVTHYDDYAGRPLTQEPISLAANDFAPTNSIHVEQPVIVQSRIRGAATFSKVRVLDDKYDNGNIADDKFLVSTTYYDVKGRVVQAFADNIMGGTDASALLYDFAGKVLATRAKHNMPNNEFNNTYVATKNDYDLHGRAKNVLKLYTLNSGDISDINKYKKLSEIKLDEFGRAKTKNMGADPDNPVKPLEVQDFSYNIQGWLTGINKEYALADGSGNTSTANAQFGYRRFGMYLGYENGDGKFTNKQWNGSITGTIWRSQGDNTARKYDYEYDNLNRFKAANFSQRNTLSTASWTTDLVNLTASVGSYDQNGNIITMQQMGIVPGTSGGVLIDNLQYTYFEKSNKLKAINDLAFGGNNNQNGKQGDFKNVNPSNGLDYDYDDNGNLKNDRNKNLQNIATGAGIISNFLDLPEKITVKDKSITEYVYDAEGSKLAKKVIQLAPGVPPPTPVTTWYMGGFVYEETTISGTQKIDLKYILHEEGKLRIIEPVDAWSAPSYQVNRLKIEGNIQLTTGANPKWGVWDYYIKDNLSNTRMVLTEEKQLQQLLCTMENPVGSPLAGEEQATFGNITNNEVVATRDFKPPLWSSNTSSKVSKLIAGTTAAIGPNAILKVMAGDKITMKVDFFYQANGQIQNTNIVNNIVTSLISALGSSVTITGGVKDNIPNNTNYVTTGINSYLPNAQPPSAPATNRPRAYINYIFFDEQFRYVGEESGARQVGDIGTATSIYDMLTPEAKAPKNGYVYVYLSNETNNVNVYFDNFNITHTRGTIVEDNAYYPYGLKIAGISARAALKPNTKEGYQGDYSEADDETGYNEFDLRFYDPQIGRWSGVDPYDEFASGYVGMGNDPINNIDTDGGGIGAGGWGAIIGAAVGFATPYIYDALNKNHEVKNKGAWGAVGALVGAGLGYGIETAYVNGGGNFGANVRAFYKGLFGGSGYVNTKHNVFNDPLNEFATQVEVPEIKLGGWYDSFETVYEPILTQYASTSGAFRRGDIQMTPTTVPIGTIPSGPSGPVGSTVVGGTINRQTDNTTVNLPQPPAGSTYVTTVTGGNNSLPGSSGIPFLPPPVITVTPPNRRIINGTTVQITVTQITGEVNVRNNVTKNVSSDNIRKVENRFKIRTVERIRKPIRRYKFLGIKIPFLKRKS